MKNLLVVLGMIVLAGSVSASEYNTENYDCTFSGVAESISNPDINLGQKKFSVNVVTTNRDWPTYAPKKIVDYKVSDKSVSLKVRRSFLGDITVPEVSIKLDSLSAEESKELLQSMGNQNIPDLKHGFSFHPLTFPEGCNIYSGAYADKASKIRMGRSNDGLIYILKVSCHKRSCR